MKNPYPFEAREGLIDQAFSGIDLKLAEGDCEVENGVKLVFSPGHPAGLFSMLRMRGQKSAERFEQ